jgi:hypothetical protein
VTIVNPSPGGGASNALTLSVSASNPKPTITSLRPNNAAVGDASGPWLVVGSNFAAGARVRWNGSNRDTYAGSSDGTVLGYYPIASDIASAGTASVTVFNPAPGGGTSNSMLFNVTASNPNPGIFSISPNTVSAAQPSVLAIKGSLFQTGARVSIGGVIVPVSSVSPNQIIVTTIADSIPGTYDVMVLNPDGGRAVFLNGFSYTAVTPSIQQLFPDRKTEGEDPFQLDVQGEDFTQGTMVYWDGSSRVTQYLNSARLRASISTFDIMKMKTVPVQVSPNGSMFSNALPFIIEANSNLQFTVEKVLPVDGSTQGNTRIRIIGKNFNPSEEGQYQVLIDNKPATNVVFISQTEIDATTPAHTAGKADVVVAVNSSTQSKAPEPFNYRDIPSTQPPLAGKSRMRIPFVVDTKEFRTNLGINNLGNTEATVDLLLVNRNGETEFRKSARIPAHGMTQFNNLSRFLEGVAGDQLTGREGYLIMDSSYPVEAWASQIDNRTEDSSIEQGQNESAAERIVIPSSSSFAPYRTSLVVINNSPNSGKVEIRARDSNGGTLAVLSDLEIKPSGYLYYEDIHRGLGLSNVYGPIEITATGGIKISATARVFTQQGTSGYFEGVDSAQSSRESILPYTQESMDFRTNLGITNPGGQQANVTVSLFDTNGQVRGIQTYTTPPHGLKQVNRVNREMGWSGEGYLRLKSDQPIIGWTSQIDNLSQDLSLVAGKTNTASSWLIPSSSGTTKFKSTLVIVNQDSTETTVQVTALDIAGNAKGSTRLTIPAYGMIAENDILASLGLDGSFGPLEIDSLDGKPIVVVSRVYSQLRTGGYFEGVPTGN